MGSLDRKILKIVTKIKRRMYRAGILDKLLFFASCACAAGLLLVIVSLLTPIYDVYYKAAAIIVPVTIAGAAAGALKPPKVRSAALKADSLGLSERTVTAVELLGNESSIAFLQKEDTLAHLESLDYKKGIPLVSRRKYLGVLLILVMALAASGFIYNPMNSRAAQIHELDKTKSDIIRQIDDMMKRVEKNPNLTEEQKSQMQDRLSKLKQDIRSAGDDDQISKALEKNAMKMNADSKNQKDINDKIKKIAQELSNSKSMSSSEKGKLAEEMASLANSIENDPKLRDALTEGAKDLQSGADTKELSKQLSDKAQNDALKDTLDELSKELDDLKNSGKESKPGEGKTEPGSPNDSNKPQDGTTSSGEKKDDGDSKNSSGSDMSNPEGVGLNKKNSSIKKTGEYEKIYSPSMLGGEGPESQLNGKESKSGSSDTVESGDDAEKGESISYDRVYGQYLEQAFEGMDSSDIPEGLQEIIRDYFVSLDE